MYRHILYAPKPIESTVFLSDMVVIVREICPLGLKYQLYELWIACAGIAGWRAAMPFEKLLDSH